MTASSVVIDWRHTGGTPCPASSEIASGFLSAVRLRRSPHCVSRPKLRFIADVRRRIRCDRRRSRSRLARSSRPGTQTSGTRSRRTRSANTRVDAVGLARQRGDRLDLARVGQANLPADQGELVADPHGAAHHLDAATDLLVGAQREDQPRKTVLVGGDRALPERTVLVERAPTGPAGAPVDPEILHAVLL